MPSGQRIRVTALPQVVFVLVNDERPPDNGEISLKQRHFWRAEMERAIMFFCGRDVPEIPRVRICP